MREYFDRFVTALSDLHHNDWSALHECFRAVMDEYDTYDKEDEIPVFDESILIKYYLNGLEDIVVHGDPIRAHSTFETTIQTLVPHVTYLNGSDTDCVFRYVIFVTTAMSGSSTTFSGHGYMEFHPEFGYITKLVMYSTDSQHFASLVSSEYLTQLQESHEEPEEISF